MGLCLTIHPDRRVTLYTSDGEIVLEFMEGRHDKQFLMRVSAPKSVRIVRGEAKSKEKRRL